MSYLTLTVHSEHTKQADQSWGAPTGEAEWNDERAGDAIAASEAQQGGWDDSAAQGAPGFIDSAAGAGTEGGEEFSGGAAGADDAENMEPEDKSVSYADWLASQSEKKQAELGPKEPRRPVDKEGLENVKPVSRDDDEYFAGATGGNKRGKERRQKDARAKVDVDLAWQPAAADTRGGGRGGRGERRGGDRGGRAEYRGRGGNSEFRGRGRGRGDGDYRGEYRGGRGGRGRAGSGQSPQVAVDDESAFPSLGS